MLKHSKPKSLLQNVIKQEKLNARHSKLHSVESSEIELPILVLSDLYCFPWYLQFKKQNKYFADYISTKFSGNG